MKYILMNKDTPVLSLLMDADSGTIIEVGKIYNLEYAPPGLNPYHEIPNASDISKWWENRAIPSKRKGIEKSVAQFGLTFPQLFLQESLGFSLSDQYWLNPVDDQLDWKDVNFFDHDFSYDLGTALFNQAPLTNRITFKSPDLSCIGNLPKHWKISKGKRMLLKAGDYPYFQEPNNEAAASRILDQLGFKHVTYALDQDGERQVSVCENFITINTELVTAYQLLNTIPKAENQTMYAHFLEVLEINNIPGYQRSMNEMLASDYLLNNVDRHFRNFGFIRNVETLKYEGWAPIFDNGNSLWYKQDVALIKDLNEMRPFFMNPEAQLSMIKSFDSFDAGKFTKVTPIIGEELARNRHISSKRIEAICKMVSQRIEKIIDTIF